MDWYSARLLYEWVLYESQGGERLPHEEDDPNFEERLVVFRCRKGEGAVDGPTQAAVYDRSRLSPSDTLAGPAIVVQMDATTAIPPGWSGAVDAWGNIILERL